MKVYLASSWKQEYLCKNIAAFLRGYGYEVDLFCEESDKRTIFSFSDLPNRGSLNGIEMLRQPIVQKAFNEDKKWLDWADICIMLLPCGNSAHLEAGYAKGQGKELWIVGDFPVGEFDVMYGFADKVFNWIDFMEYAKLTSGNFDEEAVKTLKPERKWDGVHWNTIKKKEVESELSGKELDKEIYMLEKDLRNMKIKQRNQKANQKAKPNPTPSGT